MSCSVSTEHFGKGGFGKEVHREKDLTAEKAGPGVTGHLRSNAFVMQDKYLLGYILRSPERISWIFFWDEISGQKGKDQILEAPSRPIQESIKEFTKKSLVDLYRLNQVIKLVPMIMGQTDTCPDVIQWKYQHHLCHFMSYDPFESNSEEIFTQFQSVGYFTRQLILIEKINHKNRQSIVLYKKKLKRHNN